MAKTHADNERWKKALRRQEDFLIQRLTTEWDEAEKSARRAELVHKAKASANMMVKSALILLAIAGFATVSVVAPKIFAIYDRSGQRRRFFDRKRFQQTINYLHAQNYAVRKRVGDDYSLHLTERGRDVIFGRAFRDLKIPRPSSWNGWWYIVIFDIPNRHKHARDSLRDRLKVLGFYPLQESVFIFPYPCDEEITFLTLLFNLGDYVRVIRTNQLSFDDDVRKFFALT